MPLVETSIKIQTPVEKVFDTMIDPESIPKFAPIHAVSNIRGIPGEIGNSADYEYHLLGIRLKQTMTVLVVHRPHSIVYEMSGGIPGKWMYVLEPHEGGTVVWTRVDYSVPAGIIGRIANWLFINRMNRKNLEIGQAGLKRFCESLME